MKLLQKNNVKVEMISQHFLMVIVILLYCFAKIMEMGVPGVNHSNLVPGG